MSYRLKSLVYFTCFLASTFAYYAMDEESSTNNSTTTEVAELKMAPNTLE